MRSIALSILALLFVSVILAAQARPTTNRPAEELYKANCVMCHMPDGNAAIPNMNFVDGKWLHGNTPAQLAKVITNGVPGTAISFWPVGTPTAVSPDAKGARISITPGLPSAACRY